MYTLITIKQVKRKPRAKRDIIVAPYYQQFLNLPGAELILKTGHDIHFIRWEGK